MRRRRSVPRSARWKRAATPAPTFPGGSCGRATRARRAMPRATALGLLDDAAFARNYVETRSARGRGPARLTQDLIAMGVERRDIDTALAAHWPDGPGDVEVPLALVTRRAAQLAGLPPAVRRRRLLAFLARRGYRGHRVNAVVSRALTGA